MSEKILNIILKKAKEFRAKKVYLFGSAATGSDFRDIDIATEGIKGTDLLLFAGEIENEIFLNVDIVDIGEENEFNEIIKPDLKLIYESR
jgi:predicted nucleotidyltransferase